MSTTRPFVPPSAVADPVAILKSLTGLRQIISLYPVGHPIVEQAIQLLENELEPAWHDSAVAEIDVIRGDAHLNGVPFRLESRQQESVLREFLALGFDSIHVARGVTRDELRAVANLMVACRDGGPSSLVGPALAGAGVAHVTLGRLVELDTRSTAQQWPEAPTPLDPDYADSLRMAEDAFGEFAAGRVPTAGAVRDLLQLLMFKVAGNTAALAQILSVKQYENHTYCHSVNVSVLSLLLSRHIGLDEATQAVVVEGALLHDVGKTRVPVEILRKPGALDQRERRTIERHPMYGAAMLVEVPGLHPLTPVIALEHHRHAVGRRLSGHRIRPAAPAQPARLGRRRLRGGDGCARIPAAGPARTGVPRARPAGRHAARCGARQGVRQRGDLLPARHPRADLAR